jgi:DNA-binding response OmpR family regulator
MSMTTPASHLDPMIPKTILVVDPKPSDYDCLLPAAAAEGCEVRFFAAGRAVLRHRREMRGGLVIINVELPDLSGFDLVEMLQPFPTGTAVFLVADRYAVEDEVRALRLGVSSYLCKPLEGSVFHECRSIQRALADC